jgi:hypothetical protein
MLTLGTLLWVGVIAVSRVMEGGNKSVVGKQNTVQLVHSTAAALQSGKDFRPVALDIVQNVTEWWAFRQSEPQKQRRLEKKAAKEEAKMLKLQEVQNQKDIKKAELAQREAEKLRRAEDQKELKRKQQEEKAAKGEPKVEKLQKAESDKEMGIPELGHKEAEKLRRAEEQKELKRKQLEAKEAEKERKKEFERVEAERLKAEKERLLEEEARLKRVKSEEKYRLRQRENELKQLKAEEKVTKKRRELEEKERRKRGKLEGEKQFKKPEDEFKPNMPESSEKADKVIVESEDSTPQAVAFNNPGPTLTDLKDSQSALPSPPISECETTLRLDVTDDAH